MDPASPDARLSNYRLERLLGAGGMGSVYLARDLALDRPVAIKFIAPDKAADASARRRLIREARAAAALDHPNICGVHEVIDDADGRACIVMQYVEGETLAEVLRRGPLDVRQALDIAADLAAALAAAHARNIIHRDVKPQNVIITTDRRTMLLDFGIARQNEGKPAADDVTATSLTTAGMIVGTPAYMSPEQAQQLPIDGRSDLFSLGGVLFECLTGQRAFKGDTPLRLASEILQHHPPPVSSLRAGLTEQHDELCRRLLAKHPDDRFKSAEELLGALRVLKTDTGRQAVTHDSGPDPANGSSAARRFRSRRALVAMAAVIVVAAVGSWAWMKPNADFEGTPEAIALYEQGTGWVRAGAYDSGRRALQGAIDRAPGYVPAYVRLSEACVELDDLRCANEALLEIDQLVPDEARLDELHRLRVQAVRAVVLRNFPAAIDAYSKLANRTNDAGGLVDVGRAQEAAAKPLEARRSYERAIALDPSYAAAHLRRAVTLADQGESQAAFDAFSKAEELYRTGSNAEGQAEVLLRRGAFFNRLGRIPEARKAVEQALALSGPLGHREQAIRADLALSGVLGWEGRFDDAQAKAAEAVENALETGMNTIAAEGMIDLAIAWITRPQNGATPEEQRKAIIDQLTRAQQLADDREARRTSARAALQRASVLSRWGNPAEALRVAEQPLRFLRESGYRRSEATALSIISRANEVLGDYPRAREAAVAGLKLATDIGDEGEQATAYENLAGQATAVGSLPEAADYRLRTESIRRRQDDVSGLAFELTNRAELLLRLGRFREAVDLLAECETKAAKKIPAFVGRARRVQSLRALHATLTRNFASAVRESRALLTAPEGVKDVPGRLAARLLVHAEAETGGKRIPTSEPWMTEKDADGPARLELRYWELTARLSSGDAKGVLDQALATLQWKGATVSPEFEWRIAALGAAAARVVNDTNHTTTLANRATESLDRIRVSWKDAFPSYNARPDLVHLRRKAGLIDRAT